MAAIQITTKEFHDLIKGDKPVLVDYWAPWCGYCRRISAAYDKVADLNAERLVVAKINIDEEAELAEQEKIEVIPTLVLYKNGQAVSSITAPGSKAVIDSFIEDALSK